MEVFNCNEIDVLTLVVWHTGKAFAYGANLVQGSILGRATWEGLKTQAYWVLNLIDIKYWFNIRIHSIPYGKAGYWYHASLGRFIISALLFWFLVVRVCLLAINWTDAAFQCGTSALDWEDMSHVIGWSHNYDFFFTNDSEVT